jgi:hypothetical protein
MSIFNPWVILGFIFALGGAAATGYHKGVHSEQDKQKLIIAGLNEEARTKEQALVAAVSIQSTQLMKANQNAKLIQQKRNADLDSGALRLRVAVKASECAVHATADPAAASRVDPEPPTAELSAEVGKALFDIASEGDAAIRKLSTCVSLYNEALQTLRTKP